MRKLSLAVVIGLCAVFMLVPSGGWGAPPTGPQPMPEAACNAASARPNVPVDARDFVPHFHDFDLDGIQQCYHANPTYPPATSDLE
jgi:hypothetical protein